MTSVEELVLEFEGRAKEADGVAICVLDRLVLAGQEAAADVGMAALLDRVHRSSGGPHVPLQEMEAVGGPSNTRFDLSVGHS